MGDGQLAGEHQVRHPVRCLEYIRQRANERVGVRHRRELGTTTRRKPLVAHALAPSLLGLPGREILDQLLRKAAQDKRVKRVRPPATRSVSKRPPVSCKCGASEAVRERAGYATPSVGASRWIPLVRADG